MNLSIDLKTDPKKIIRKLHRKSIITYLSIAASLVIFITSIIYIQDYEKKLDLVENILKRNESLYLEENNNLSGLLEKEKQKNRQEKIMEKPSKNKINTNIPADPSKKLIIIDHEGDNEREKQGDSIFQDEEKSSYSNEVETLWFEEYEKNEDLINESTAMQNQETMNQEKSKTYITWQEELEEEDIFVSVQEMPGFKGGDVNNFSKYIEKELRAKLKEDNDLENVFSGRMWVYFVVNVYGITENITIEKSIDSRIDKLVKDIVENSPRWKPGKQNGKPVNVSFVVPVTIHFR